MLATPDTRSCWPVDVNARQRLSRKMCTTSASHLRASSTDGLEGDRVPAFYQHHFWSAAVCQCQRASRRLQLLPADSRAHGRLLSPTLHVLAVAVESVTLTNQAMSLRKDRECSSMSNCLFACYLSTVKQVQQRARAAALEIWPDDIQFSAALVYATDRAAAFAPWYTKLPYSAEGAGPRPRRRTALARGAS